MVLETARAALETGPVCDGCLGRCFGDRGTGLSNEDRGEALRICVAMAADEPLEPVNPADCWVCEGLTPDFDAWADRVVDAVEDLTFDTFLVGTHVPDPLEEHEADLRKQAGLDETAGEPFNTECNREVGNRLENRLDAVVDFDYPDVVMIMNLESEAVDLQLNPAYLAGRYRKREPGLAQRIRVCRVCNGQGTQWREGAAQPCEACDGSGYDTKDSVEWYITEPIKAAMDGSETVFNAAGREDDEVLVRGDGRPFVVEVKEPRTRPPDLERLEDEIATSSDDAIAVEGLAEASRELVEHLSQAAVRETYRLEVAFSTGVSETAFTEAMDALDSASVRQRIERGERVTEQLRTMGNVSGELTAEEAATVNIESTEGVDLQALMVGGADRSDPNLADLLDTEVTVETIAVVDIEGEDEPLVKNTNLSG